jgi:di/tricarboxylate transporter
MGMPADLQMWLTYLVIAASVVLYALERFSIELTSLGAIVAYLIIFSVFPLPSGSPLGGIDAAALLAGFANPALITILALLVVGRALFQTDALERPAEVMSRLGGRNHFVGIGVVLLIAGVISAFLNNTPVVVMFVPIVTAISAGRGISASKVLMPLSFISIFGGMTTLIGSSTNLLVADVARTSIGLELGFFSHTVPGLFLAAAGLVYVLFIMPRLLKSRIAMTDQMTAGGGRQFIAEIQIDYGHPLVGMESRSGLFAELKDMTVRLVQRREHRYLPPFEDIILRPGDTIIVAATRSALTRALSTGSASLSPEDSETEVRESTTGDGGFTLAEVVVAPGSRLSGRAIEQSGVHASTGAIVLGIQRRSRMPRMPMAAIRMEAGDVLLVGGSREIIEGLRANRDLLLLEWSAADIPHRRYAPRALAIFAIVIALAGTNTVPIVIAALLGAFAMLIFGCLNIRQAIRALDSRIYMLIGASLASAAALQATGGAIALAEALVTLMGDRSPAFLLSGVFLLVAVLTNVLSNNATAVLFTPIAAGIALRVGVAPEAFVVAVILAANCSFATPMSYQTNLLVMGPGQYRFADYLIAGGPLIFIMWIVFTFVGPWYYAL